MLGIIMIIATGCSNNNDSPMNSSSIALSKGGYDTVSPLSITGPGKPWRNHAAPWDFLWDNSLDNNHEFKTNGNGNLVGFMYVEFTDGERKSDAR